MCTESKVVFMTASNTILHTTQRKIDPFDLQDALSNTII